MLTKSLPLKPLFPILLGLFLIFLNGCGRLSPQIFTSEELQWLAAHKGKVEVLFGYEAPPNAYHDTDGSYKGLLVDFLSLIEKNIGTSFTFHKFAEWDELIEYSKIHHNFIIVGIAPTIERQRYLSFTDPFIKVPYVIVSQRSSTIEHTTDLQGKKICTVANYAINDFLAEKLPELNISQVTDNREGLLGVSTGIYDAMVINQMYASFLIENQGISNLQIAGESGYLNRLSAAASIQDPILSAILEKAVDQIPPRTTRQLYQKWLGHSENRFVSRTLLTALLGVILCITTLLAIFWGWNISLKKNVRQRTRDILQSRKNYITTLNSIGDGVIATDAKGIITGMNPVAERLVGCSKEKALHKPLAAVFKIIDTTTREPLDNPVAEVVTTSNTINHQHHPTLVSSDGTEYIIDNSAAPIKDEQGNISGVILVFRNITNRYRIQQKLRENEHQLAQYIAKAPIGVAVLNLRHQFIHVNKKMSEFSGFTEDELLHKELKELLIHSYHDELSQKLTKALQSGSSKITPEFIHKNGSRLFSSIDIGFINNDKYLIFFNDIHQQKLAEDELLKMNKLRSIGTLAGGIAHDFNNILMGLFGNIEIAKELTDQDHQAYEYLDRAGRSLTRATRLTQQLLTFSKGGEPVKEHTQLLTLVKETINFDLAGSNVLPEVQAAPDLWLANVDKGQIGQVFSNLFLNAKQAMPGGGHIEIKLSNVAVDQNSSLPLQAGDYVCVTLADTGTGIESKHLQRIFDPYFTTKQTGSGLGLASTYSIMVKHKGHIQVDSIQGQGTTFTLYLPAKRKSTETKSAPVNIALNDLTNCHILIMDDEQEILKLTRRMGEKSGAQITTVASGEEAIYEYQAALTSGNPYDVTILDLTVPGAMGGQEAAARIKEIDPEAQLIVSSGYAEDPVLAHYKEFGFSEVLNKPYTKIAFLQAIAKIIARQVTLNKN